MHAKVRRLSREGRAEQLLDVAEELFATRGFEDTSMEDIARAAGVTRPVVYAHFSSKDGIFLECVRRARIGLEHQLGALSALEAGSVTLHRLLELGGEVFFGILEENPRRWALLFSPSSALSGELAEALTDLRFGTAARIAEVTRPFTAGLDEERLTAFAHCISGVGEQLGRWWLRNPGVPRAAVVGYFRDFVAAGLAPWWSR